MFRSLASLATLTTVLTLGLGDTASAGRGINIRVGGVQVGARPGGGVSIGLPGRGPGCGSKPPVIRPIHPPVIRPIHPPVVRPIHPPVVRPKPPIVITPPPVVCPKPPVVIAPPPVICPKPPIVIAPKPPIVVSPRPVICPKPVILPCGCQESCTCHPVHPWRFGMSVVRVQSQFGVGLQVAELAPGGPAANYGLKVGDVLLVAGAVNLAQATSNTHGAELIQTGVGPDGVVQFTLVDAATNGLANLAMVAEAVGAPPAPTAVGTVALNPSEPAPTL